MFIYFEREREGKKERKNGAGAERDGDTESEADSRLQAICTELDTMLKLTNLEIMT